MQKQYSETVFKTKQSLTFLALLRVIDHVVQEPAKQEFSDWPHGLLSIGTFGNNNTKKEEEKRNLQDSQVACQDHLQDITLEEVGELQKELKLILDKQVVESTSSDELGNGADIDKTSNHTLYDDVIPSAGSVFQRSFSAVFGRGKDSRLDNTNNDIRKKTLSFLLKKMFVCSSGFGPTPSLRDPHVESRLEKSRMDKVIIYSCICIVEDRISCVVLVVVIVYMHF